MEEVIAWIWLQNILGVENPRLRAILDFFGNVRAIYAADEMELNIADVFTAKECAALLNKDKTNAEKIFEVCQKNHYRVLSFLDEDYPISLKEIEAPPILLYVAGEMPDLNGNNSIAMVGTRHPSVEGQRKTFDLAYQLAKNNRVIISGGALGIDTAAHKGALQAGGLTVCIMGCGLHYNYMAENKPLRDTIAHHGAVISEYPPDTPPTRYTFPKRNRIIAGLSSGTVVMEAGLKSGALITARDTAKQGRRLMAFEDKEHKLQSEGVSLLIREGAAVVHCAEDVLKLSPIPKVNIQQIENIRKQQKEADKASKTQMVQRQPQIKEKTVFTETTKKSEKPLNTEIEGVSDEAKKIYAVLSEGLTADECALKSGLPISKVLTALTELEIFGLAVCHAGSRYERL
ncbi:MAG: DNA-processing protein DprA [Acutalibacteraceae bacterium]